MGQAEYEAFKAKLREWTETHPEEYAAFEESMNTRDMAGCQAVLLQAIALIPQYRKLARPRPTRGCSTMSTRSNKPPKTTTSPAN